MLNIFYDWITSQRMAVCKCRFAGEFVDTAHLHVLRTVRQTGPDIVESPEAVHRQLWRSSDGWSAGRASRVAVRL